MPMAQAAGCPLPPRNRPHARGCGLHLPALGGHRPGEPAERGGGRCLSLLGNGFCGRNRSGSEGLGQALLRSGLET